MLHESIRGLAVPLGIETSLAGEEAAAWLRRGGLVAFLAEVLGEPPAEPVPGAPRVPGAFPSHYAPRTPLGIVATEALTAEVAQRLSRRHAAVLARFAAPAPARCVWQVMPTDPEAYARELYARLRALDALNTDRLLIEAPPGGAAWEAVRDRLARAARRRDFASGEDDP